MKILELQILKKNSEISRTMVRWTVEKVSLGRLVMLYRLKTLKLVGFGFEDFWKASEVLVLAVSDARSQFGCRKTV